MKVEIMEPPIDMIDISRERYTLEYDEEIDFTETETKKERTKKERTKEDKTKEERIEEFKLSLCILFMMSTPFLFFIYWLIFGY